jgi:hypothetical protein
MAGLLNYPLSVQFSAMALLDELIAEARNGLFPESHIAMAVGGALPAWKPSGCHEWRGYVSASVLEHWGELTPEFRLAVFMMAETQASNEHWE